MGIKKNLMNCLPTWNWWKDFPIISAICFMVKIMLSLSWMIWCPNVPTINALPTCLPVVRTIVGYPYCAWRRIYFRPESYPAQSAWILTTCMGSSDTRAIRLVFQHWRNKCFLDVPSSWLNRFAMLRADPMSIWRSTATSWHPKTRAVTKALIGGGGCIFIYSRSSRRISFEINCNDHWFQKKIRRAEREYMNIHPPN